MLVDRRRFTPLVSSIQARLGRIVNMILTRKSILRRRVPTYSNMISVFPKQIFRAKYFMGARFVDVEPCKIIHPGSCSKFPSSSASRSLTIDDIELFASFFDPTFAIGSVAKNPALLAVIKYPSNVGLLLG